MTQVNRYILRLDVRADQVHDVEMFAEANNVTRILQGARAFAAVEVGDMRCTANADKGNMITTKFNAGLLVGTVQGDQRWRCFQR